MAEEPELSCGLFHRLAGDHVTHLVSRDRWTGDWGNRDLVCELSQRGTCPASHPLPTTLRVVSLLKAMLCVSFQRHLSPGDFQKVFGMTLDQFDRLALWKKNELKKAARLF